MLADVQLWLAAAIFMTSAGVWSLLHRGMRKVRWLKDLPVPADFTAWPKVSIIVPARNEEREIKEALQSLLQLHYPDYEILVVNDRSTDRTGAILQAMQARYPQLAVATVSELPPGWLGKNHALFFGAQQASGSLLLFTDADIVMHPNVLRRAVACLEREGIDHLALTPDVEMPNLFLEAFVVVFTMLFSIFTRPWKVRNPRSSAHVGIGAFNLIRRDAYQAIGTHEAIRMRPDDDLKLGKLVKKHGRVQDLLSGNGFLRVRWYTSLRELIQGLMKNAFSGLDYHVAFTVFSSALMLLVNVWPFAAVLLIAGPARWLYAATISLHAASYLWTAWQLKARWWGVFAYPLVFVLFVYIQWRAMLLTYWHNGIYWRDTHYPLAELKANRV